MRRTTISLLRRLVQLFLGQSLGRRTSEAGYAAVLVSIIVPVVGIGCAATAVDTGRWYVEVQKVQRAADAAALAGVPYLPQDLTSAVVLAKTVASRNGYDTSSPNVSVSVGIGSKATQLSVTISSTINNVFGGAIGVPKATITRTAVADYQGPAPMGSPCNTFGNEPSSGNGASSITPAGTARGSSPLTNCSQTPQFWATVEGPETGKVQGDRYQTKKCENTGVDGCSGTTNDEYDDFGYTFIVKVADAAVNTPIDLQLFDPMFVATGQQCAQLPDSTDFPTNTTNNTNASTNPYVKNGDAANRYSDDGTNFAAFCTGDSYAGTGSGASTKHSLTTSFVLRQQTDTQNPKNTPVQTDTSGNTCIKQYGAYNLTNGNISSNLFKDGASGYNAEISSQFHNWTRFCTFTPTRAGDYYLQVRTNVSLGGSGTGYIRSGNSAAADLTGNSTTGEGTNSFAIRAVTQSGKEGAVAVSGYNHMPIYVNTTAATPQFNLIRILPGAAGQKISFSYFDAGDANSSGSVRVLVPADATGTITTTPFPGGCNAIGGSAGTASTALTNCTAPFTQDSSNTSKNNGKTETITIPIPANYSCNYASFGGCWYKVLLDYGGSGVHDVTTWDATVIGDPVRLVQ
jgi:Flp pilus assembly protein TadG